MGALLVAIAAAILAREGPLPPRASPPGFPPQGKVAGYASAEQCRACHTSQYESWHGSFHRTMTEVAAPHTVLAPWGQGAALPLRDGKLDLQRRGDEYWAIFRPRGDAPTVPYRIGLTTGSHHMQLYWATGGASRELELLPYAYLREDRRWVPLRETQLAHPTAEAWRHPHWNRECIQCHATGGQPRLTKGAVETRVAEFGISCEACHGPGQAHVDVARGAADGDPRLKTSIVNPARLSAARASEVCGQCHGLWVITDHARFLDQGSQFRPGQKLADTRPLIHPGDPRSRPAIQALAKEEPEFVANRFWPDGMLRVTGRELNAVVASPCYKGGKFGCASCHAPHDYREADDQLSHDPDGDAACVQCHAPIARNLKAHTHHAPTSTGSRCMNCHMPHTTYGLLKAIRSHQISSPSAAVTLASGRPAACNLCHVDQTLAWTADYLRRWYGRRTPPLPPEHRSTALVPLLALRGDAAQRAVAVWHLGWEPARRASGENWQAAFLAIALGDSYSAVRYIAGKALKQLAPFAGLRHDYLAPAEAQERFVAEVLARWARPTLDPSRAARLLMSPDARLRGDAVRRELSARDERPLELSE